MRRWSPKALSWASALALIGALLGSGPDYGDAQPVAPQDAIPFATLFPALRTAPAPGWLRQGTRLTYYSIAGSIAGGKHRYIEDPSGNWVDPTTGKHYRQVQIGGAAGGVSGHGYTEVNVALLTGAVAVLEVRSYGLRGPNSAPVIFTEGGAVGLPGAGGDFWMNPDVLRRLGTGNSSTLKILRGPYEINGRQYSAVWIDSGGATWVYDVNTGILLHSSTAGQGASIQGPLAQGDTRQGATLIAQNTLVGVRTTKLPWAFAAAPDWVARITVLRYQGTVALHVPGSPAFPTPVSATFEREAGGANWARYRQLIMQGGAGGPTTSAQTEMAFGPALLDGLWIAPNALAGLRSGQILDTDPVTHVTASVARIGPISQGHVGVIISESSTGEVIEHVYDASTGMLVVAHTWDRVLNAETQLKLVSAR